jgi:hypothetical protein
MAYDPHSWEVNEPITKTLMNNIELGIKNAHDGVTGVNALIGERDSNAKTII